MYLRLSVAYKIHHVLTYSNIGLELHYSIEVLASMEVVNIVATVRVSSHLDLQKIASAVKDTEFPSGGNWLKMRLAPESYYVALYGSGKFVVTGVKSIALVEDVADRVISILRKAEIIVNTKQIIIQNIVSVGFVEINSTLEKIVYALDPSKVSYEPEQFPGLIYKDFDATILLFSSGKIIITGLTNEDDILEVHKKLSTLIKNIK